MWPRALRESDSRTTPLHRNRRILRAGQEGTFLEIFWRWGLRAMSFQLVEQCNLVPYRLGSCQVLDCPHLSKTADKERGRLLPWLAKPPHHCSCVSFAVSSCGHPAAVPIDTFKLQWRLCVSQQLKACGHRHLCLMKKTWRNLGQRNLTSALYWTEYPPEEQRLWGLLLLYPPQCPAASYHHIVCSGERRGRK